MAVQMEQAGPSEWGYDHAHFKGAMRRLLVPSADEYEEQECEEAAQEFLSAMKQLLSHSRWAQAVGCTIPEESHCARGCAPLSPLRMA